MAWTARPSRWRCWHSSGAPLPSGGAPASTADGAPWRTARAAVRGNGPASACPVSWRECRRSLFCSALESRSEPLQRPPHRAPFSPQRRRLRNRLADRVCTHPELSPDLPLPEAAHLPRQRHRYRSRPSASVSARTQHRLPLHLRTDGGLMHVGPGRLAQHAAHVRVAGLGDRPLAAALATAATDDVTQARRSGARHIAAGWPRRASRMPRSGSRWRSTSGASRRPNSGWSGSACRLRATWVCLGVPAHLPGNLGRNP